MSENIENLARWFPPDPAVFALCLDRSTTPRVESCCPGQEQVANGSVVRSGKHQISNHNHISSDRRNSSDKSLTNGHAKFLENSNYSNGQLQTSESINSVSRSTTNGTERKKSLQSSILSNSQNGVTLQSLKETGVLNQRSNALSPTNKVFRKGDSSATSKGQTLSDHSQTGTSSLLSTSLKGITVLGVISAMAAIGIASTGDWLALLIICAQLVAVALLIFAVLKYRWFYVALMTVRRDIKGGYRYAKILFSIGRAQRYNESVISLFDKNVKKHPNKVCFYFEEEVWNFRDVDEASNRVANYFASQGLKKGDCVSVFMENRPEYVCVWLGLSKIGIIPALINFHLRLQPLKHSIEVAKSKALIFGRELGGAIQEVVDLGLVSDLPLFATGKLEQDSVIIKNSLDLDSELDKSPITPPKLTEKINFTDKLLYIYTSGTTGLPKAAIIKNSRFLFFTMGIHNFMGISKNEVIYDPLPLYHTAGGMLGVGQALIFGCTAVLRRKFSARAYFKDCAKYNCSAAQYIGEICRYLLSTPPSPDDKNHHIRMMFGNGLRPQIWETFSKRFNIKTISEFYGATEGNCNIINIDNHVGSVGFISMIAPFIYPVTLIRIDEATGEPIRDPKTGLVMRCKPDEPGELVGKIIENHPVREFEGYADSTATTKKIVRGVFNRTDAVFRTGDVLVMDEFGYFYFKDRTGDTFRWKGENCSTAEVEAVVSNVCGLKDAVVYGVEIPGADGRAGMAAILDPEETVDMSSLAAGVTRALPSYARPLFVRVVKQIDMTGTYKMKKIDLQKDGYDVTRVSEKIYFFTGGKYVLLDNELYSKIQNCEVRV
ncbi:unnamed protein product [Orchesella dallaii]|uniref:Long-chain-fatty-acid--CoA ligase n=1 Tax=Orchesella dallaii TaxID=48710 RepID=A0ABP1RG98_9HEXA